MGLNFADQYSILHFSVGSVAYFWNIPFLIALIGHTIFELGENTDSGMKLINEYFIHPGYFSWPGGNGIQRAQKGERPSTPVYRGYTSIGIHIEPAGDRSYQA